MADTLTAARAVAVVVSAVGGLCQAAKARVVPRGDLGARMAGWAGEAYARSTERWAARVVARAVALHRALEAVAGRRFTTP